MAENEAPPAKRMRHNSKSSVQLEPNVTPSVAKCKIASNQPVTVADCSSTHESQCHVKINEQESQSMEPSPPPKRENPNLLTINPEDLLKMLNDMKLPDIFSFAESCSKLYHIAKQHFRLKHQNFDFASTFDGDLLDVANATKFFRIFGDQIHTLKMSGDFFNDNYDVCTKSLQLIANNSQQIVKVLALDGFDFRPGKVMDCLTTLFSTIETLTLDQCSVDNVTWCDMNKLKVLKLNNVDGLDSQFCKIKLVKLEAIEFNHVDFDSEDLMELIRSMATTKTAAKIKRLSIVKCCNVTTEIFGDIKRLRNLREFEFQLNQASRLEDSYRDDLMHLLSLKKLKVLKLNCDYADVRQLINGFCEKQIAIEHLELAHGLLDDATVEAISHLNTIKVLKFNDMIKFSDHLLMPIAKGLNQLEELHIKTAENISEFRITEIIRAAKRLTGLNIDAKHFDLSTGIQCTIFTAVQSRTAENQLTITIYGDATNQPIIPIVKWKGPNEKWLKMKKFDRCSNHLFPHYVWPPDESGTDRYFDDEFNYEAQTFDDDDFNYI